VDVGVGRFSGRATLERFEDDPDELGRIVARYEAAMAALRADGETIVVVDGARSAAEVHADVVRLAAEVLAPRYPGADLIAGLPPV
jgi:thymidylate kinase